MASDSAVKLSVVKFLGDGGQIIGPRPGANHFGDIEYPESELGEMLAWDGAEIGRLLASGAIVALELPEPVETDAGLLCTHRYVMADKEA